MSLLTLLQDVAAELGLKEPDSAIGSTEVDVKQLLRHLYRTGKELRDRIEWPQLTKLHTITLVDGQSSYALPTDLNRQIFETHWDQSQTWPLIGPLGAQEWRARQDGIVTALPRQHFRVKGFADNQFFIDPAPSSAEAGNNLVFEYQSKLWFRPKKWGEAVSFLATDWCFYNGNFYKTQAGGITGATPPTHSASHGEAVSDGGVTWQYRADLYTELARDTDEFFLNELLIGLGVQWRMMRARGLPYQDLRRDYELEMRRQASALRGAKTLSLNTSTGYHLLDRSNIPDTGYGS